jgi:hypothetical protein
MLYKSDKRFEDKKVCNNDTQVIRQAQHFVLRLRTMFVLDTMARELRDPLIHCHWATLNSPTRTSVKVGSPRLLSIVKL